MLSMNKVKGFEDTIEWYNQNASLYSSAAGKLAVNFAIKKFISLLPPGAKVLDAGCGSGRDSSSLSKSGMEVIGVDISEGLIRQASKNFPKIKFQLGDIRELDFPNETFEGVWAQASLVHFETLADAEKSIKEFSRVLKPGGILHIMVKEKVDDDRTKISIDKISNHDRFFIFFTKEEIELFLKKNSLSLISIQDRIPDPAKRKGTVWIWSLARKQKDLIEWTNGGKYNQGHKSPKKV